MTELLARIFIKDRDNIKNEKVRSAYGFLAGIVGIICNLTLFSIKFLVGWAVHSISVTSDAFNNLSDAASSVISLVGVWVAKRPADREHPYGHGRAEYIAALAVAILVLEVGFTFFKTAIDRILHPQALQTTWITLVLLCLSVCLKLWMSFFNRKLGKKIGSKVMEATAADAAGDVLATSATILSLVLFSTMGINIDGWIGLAVSVIIMVAGVGIIRDTLEPLIGEKATEEEIEALYSLVKDHEGILGAHDLLIHHYGPSRCIASIHAEMDNRGTLDEVHRIADHIEREARERYGVELVIHVDPVERKDRDILKHKKIVGAALNRIAPDILAHDFQMVKKDGTDFLYFDVRVPLDMREEAVEKLLQELKARIREMDPNSECVIDVDR